MSANRIFLVCQHCPQLEDALLIAERADGEAQYIKGKMKWADDWFAKHQRCGDPDGFKLAYHRPQGWDVPKLASKPASAVRLVLANGNGEEH